MGKKRKVSEGGRSISQIKFAGKRKGENGKGRRKKGLSSSRKKARGRLVREETRERNALRRKSRS